MNVILSKILSKYNLYDNRIITKKELEQISNNEKIELRDLIFILGCYYKILYKQEKCWTRINLINKKITDKYKIDMIRMDLKYIKCYGTRYYTNQEIVKICGKYKVSVDTFLTYIYKFKFCYYSNIEVLEKNRYGLWIGENISVSPIFIRNNYEKISKLVKIQATVLCNKYNCAYLKQDLIDEAIKSILSFGKIEKNYTYDNDLIIHKMIYRTKYIMLKYIIKSFKLASINSNDSTEEKYVIEPEQFESSLLKSSIHEWLYNVKFNLLEKILIEEIIKELDLVIENRVDFFRNISSKLNINILNIYKLLDNISKILITNNKVRINRDGRVIIKSYE